MKNKSIRKKRHEIESFSIEKDPTCGKQEEITFIKLQSVADPALTAFHVPLYLLLLSMDMETEARSHDLTWLVTLPVYY